MPNELKRVRTLTGSLKNPVAAPIWVLAKRGWMSGEIMETSGRLRGKPKSEGTSTFLEPVLGRDRRK